MRMININGNYKVPTDWKEGDVSISYITDEGCTDTLY